MYKMLGNRSVDFVFLKLGEYLLYLMKVKILNLEVSFLQEEIFGDRLLAH